MWLGKHSSGVIQVASLSIAQRFTRILALTVVQVPEAQEAPWFWHWLNEPAETFCAGGLVRDVASAGAASELRRMQVSCRDFASAGATSEWRRMQVSHRNGQVPFFWSMWPLPTECQATFAFAGWTSVYNVESLGPRSWWQ